ncbi:MAG TPA: hypothetical protein VFN74_03180, partial [Chloroflexota bacterium]|nr:hypothetical protein [Chloroflexota bacterium]
APRDPQQSVRRETPARRHLHDQRAHVHHGRSLQGRGITINLNLPLPTRDGLFADQEYEAYRRTFDAVVASHLCPVLATVPLSLRRVSTQ